MTQLKLVVDQPNSGQAMAKDTIQTLLPETIKDAGINLPCPTPPQQKKELTPGRFGITRTNTSLEITYDSKRFFKIVSSVEITNKNIKDTLFYSDVMKYLSVGECRMILDIIGEDHNYQI